MHGLTAVQDTDSLLVADYDDCQQLFLLTINVSNSLQYIGDYSLRINLFIVSM